MGTSNPNSGWRRQTMSVDCTEPWSPIFALAAGRFVSRESFCSAESIDARSHAWFIHARASNNSWSIHSPFGFGWEALC